MIDRLVTIKFAVNPMGVKNEDNLKNILETNLENNVHQNNLTA